MEEQIDRIDSQAPPNKVLALCLSPYISKTLAAVQDINKVHLFS
jgi:hypothetical protein